MVRLLNFCLYQTGWFALVLGAAFGRPWGGIGIALILVAIHLWLTTELFRQIQIMVASASVGLLVDSLLLQMNVFRFPSGTLVAGLPPLWMTILWVQFATTFRYCLIWLSERYVVCSLLGLLGAPLVFVGGERLGAVEFVVPRIPHLFVLGILWSVAIPLLIYLSDRIHRHCQNPPGYRGI